MKLGLILLSLISFSAFSQTNCLFTVESTCLNTLSVEEQKIVDDLVFDETAIADFFQMPHLSNIKIYKAKNLYKLSKNFVDSKSLKSFISFATKELGVYSAEEEMDVVFALKTGEFLDSKIAFKNFMTKIALDQDEVNSTVFTGCDIPFDSIMSEVRSRPANFEKLINLLTSGANTSFAVYALADNNNENVQDAQYMISSGDYLVLINQFWFL